ncbi:hypothetical protein P153DRAFT_361823 [Dothidotthia symphoricarpi CBS 119687]|uniref:Uncharacterized protein n=1 Tax=Dothidotthia symphoricarpi CBS 119687 TaxID=1392245 RepID=A0A6A5ZVZ6_9PLEO|nr:uncharacterized protein P153DRAFT_361823 [Dothidotthia symphoricarpi CBS 119687]KAF2123699.1 hypothetical protein P153DRAFT_361823 [Dothidotthia symphoricarpi CBS 119687]
MFISGSSSMPGRLASKVEAARRLQIATELAMKAAVDMDNAYTDFAEFNHMEICYSPTPYSADYARAAIGSAVEQWRNATEVQSFYPRSVQGLLRNIEQEVEHENKLQEKKKTEQKQDFNQILAETYDPKPKLEPAGRFDQILAETYENSSAEVDSRDEPDEKSRSDVMDESPKGRSRFVVWDMTSLEFKLSG